MMGMLNVIKAKQKNEDEEGEKNILPYWQTQIDVEPPIGPRCTACAFSNSADMLAIGDDIGAVSILNPKTGAIIKKLGAVYRNDGGDNGRGIAMNVRWNPTESKKNVFRVALSTGVVEQWDAIKGTSSVTKSDFQEALALDYSPDGRQFAAGGVCKKDGAAPGEGNSVRIYSEGSSQLVRSLCGESGNPGHSNRITCIRFGSNTSLASGSMDGTVKLWSTGVTAPLFTIPGPDEGQTLDPSSIDYYEQHYLLIGSCRPYKHLSVYDLRMNKLVQEVSWQRQKPKPPNTGQSPRAMGKWHVAKAAFTQKTNVQSLCFTDGGARFVAGGTGSNTVKIFTKNVPPAYPVDEAAKPEGVALNYSPTACFTAPSGVVGVAVSPKPVIDFEGVEHKVIAVATAKGKAFGVLMPDKLPNYPEPVSM